MCALRILFAQCKKPPALGHSRCDRVAATLCEITQASRRRRGHRHRACQKCARLVRTIAPRKCRTLRGTQTHACLPTVFLDALRTARRGQLPTDDATPPREQKHTQPGQTLKLAEKEMDAEKKRCRAKILPFAHCIRPTNGKSQAQSIASANTISPKWAKHPSVAVKELMDRVVRYLTSMRSTGKWSHRQQSSHATMKHHDTSNTTTIKTLPQRPIVSFPRRATNGDAKNLQRDALFSQPLMR